MHHLIIAQVAASAAAGPAPTQADAWSNVFTLVLLFAGMYFLLIRPQQQKEKDLQKLMKELKKGDEVVTFGGIIGTVEKLTDDTADIRVASNVTMTFQRAAIQSKYAPVTETTEKKA